MQQNDILARQSLDGQELAQVQALAEEVLWVDGVALKLDWDAAAAAWVWASAFGSGLNAPAGGRTDAVRAGCGDGEPIGALDLQSLRVSRDDCLRLSRRFFDEKNLTDESNLC